MVNERVTQLFLYLSDSVVPLCVDMCLVAEEGLWCYFDLDILGDYTKTINTSNVLPYK